MRPFDVVCPLLCPGGWSYTSGCENRIRLVIGDELRGPIGKFLQRLALVQDDERNLLVARRLVAHEAVQSDIDQQPRLGGPNLRPALSLPLHEPKNVRAG